MKKIFLFIMSLFYVAAGINHFIHPDFYLKLMPSYIPFHLFLIYLSGVIEIILGSLVVIKKFQKMAGWLIILMLFAFLPVHIQMIIDNFSPPGTALWIAVIRLPVQFLLMFWAYRVCDLKIR